MDYQLMMQILNQIPPDVLGQMISEISDPRRFVKKDLLDKELPQYLNTNPLVGGSNAPMRGVF
uniref:Uncharacterized protein n=1 Tax=viral metagenome TaxID=1070528 RepID=A0A6M3L5L8_9ZZZZ